MRRSTPVPVELVQQIARDECAALGYSEITPALVLGKGRTAAVAWVRARVCKRLRDEGYSFPAIGRAIGRDHSTVMHAVRRDLESSRPFARTPEDDAPPIPPPSVLTRRYLRMIKPAVATTDDVASMLGFAYRRARAVLDRLYRSGRVERLKARSEDRAPPRTLWRLLDYPRLTGRR